MQHGLPAEAYISERFFALEQERVFATFHRVLPEGGFLVLGAVERISRQAAQWFEPVEARERIYRHRTVA